MIVGIDLGTTNSLVGVIEKGRPRLFKDGDSTLIPSIVTFNDSAEPEIGKKAAKLEKMDRTVYSSKRFIGKGKADVAEWMDILPFDFSKSDEHMIRFGVGEKAYTPIEIAAFILRHLKKVSEGALGAPIQKAVITVPAYFNDSQRQATKFAGELAGLEVVRIVNEPTAACLAYGLDKKAHGNVAVFDLGGGTFDISILRVHDGVFEVLATNGNTALGGDDFDLAIARKLAEKFSAPFKTDDDRAKLIVQAEEIKRELSDKESTTFSGKTVTRADLESWILPIIQKVVDPCLQCLGDAKLKKESITDVILVGGSTRVPLVKQKVQEIFGREPIATLNPDEVVAIGAAVQANILMGQMGDMLLLDVIPLSLGIETMGGVVAKIIHRNSTIPVSASEHFSTYVDGQVSVDIHVVQGERELVKDNRSLARFQLKGIPPLPAGVPKIEVEFIIDANGILNVKAQELRTHTTASVVVNPSYGLDDTQVEKMLSDSFEFAEADFESRFLIEARVEADAVVRATRKSLEKGKHLLQGDEGMRINDAIADVEAQVLQQSHKEIRKALDALNEATRPLAERLLNEAVQTALKDKEI